jgi:putative FmdB family regulatory protein
MALKDEFTVPLKCPECGHEFEETLARLKDDPTIQCPACGKDFKVSTGGTAAEVVDDIDRLDRAWDKLTKG